MLYIQEPVHHCSCLSASRTIFIVISLQLVLVVYSFKHRTTTSYEYRVQFEKAWIFCLQPVTMSIFCLGTHSHPCWNQLYQHLNSGMLLPQWRPIKRSVTQTRTVLASVALEKSILLFLRSIPGSSYGATAVMDIMSRTQVSFFLRISFMYLQNCGYQIVDGVWTCCLLHTLVYELYLTINIVWNEWQLNNR